MPREGGEGGGRGWLGLFGLVHTPLVTFFIFSVTPLSFPSTGCCAVQHGLFAVLYDHAQAFAKWVWGGAQGPEEARGRRPRCLWCFAFALAPCSRPFPPARADLKYGDSLTIHCVYNGLISGSVPPAFSASKILGR